MADSYIIFDLINIVPSAVLDTLIDITFNRNQFYNQYLPTIATIKNKIRNMNTPYIRRFLKHVLVH
jgi:hypothetical protein